MDSSSEMLLVVHVPKTAGTSFRHALDKYFGKSNIVRDYGPEAKLTSNIVRQCEYGENRIHTSKIYRHAVEAQAKVLTGHFPVNKYAEYFPAKNIIAFVREPLERACSEYLHRVKYADYLSSFDEFMEQTGMINMQSRFLRNYPEAAFMALTERYIESLNFINKSYGLKLRQYKKNVRNKGGGRGFMGSLSEGQIDYFYKLNASDVELYEKAVERFASLNTI